jgi:hypothetical protein
MEELYAEGLATHGGPGLCVDDPRGRGEALAGHVQAGLLSREIKTFGVPTLSKRRKATSPVALSAGRWGTSRGHGNQGMYGTSVRENRECPCPPARLITGRAVQGTPGR